MHLGARKSLVLPSISNPARQYRRKQRTKSIAKVAIYGDLMEENNCKVEKPLKLPKIYPKRTSVRDNNFSTWLLFVSFCLPFDIYLAEGFF